MLNCCVTADLPIADGHALPTSSADADAAPFARARDCVSKIDRSLEAAKASGLLRCFNARYGVEEGTRRRSALPLLRAGEGEVRKRVTLVVGRHRTQVAIGRSHVDDGGVGAGGMGNVLTEFKRLKKWGARAAEMSFICFLTNARSFLSCF